MGNLCATCPDNFDRPGKIPAFGDQLLDINFNAVKIAGSLMTPKNEIIIFFDLNFE